MMAHSQVHGLEASGVPCAFRGCRGSFYPAQGDVGVVLCAPWGLEEAAARAVWRELAADIARAGYPCLRFDYPGTGDSLGSMTGLTDAAAWTQAVSDATGFLRAYTGVSRFVLIGQSLGAALALEAAAQNSSVTGLVLIAPATSGAGYARQLRHLAGPGDPAASLDLAGYALGAAMIASLSRIEPLTRGAGGLTGAIVFDRAGRKAGAEISEHLRRLGVPSSLRGFAPGPASGALVPANEIIEALTSLHPPQAATGPARRPPLPATLRAALFKEEPLTWMGGGGLLCLPAGGPAGERTDGDTVLVFLDAGFSPQVGWRRMAVDLTRALAASGQGSLRLDVQNLSSEAIRETLARAAEALAARGLSKIVVAATGEQAGAALRAACAMAIPQVIAIDPSGLAPRGEADGAPSRLGRLAGQLRANALRRDGGERIVFYQDLIESLGRRRAPGLWTRLRGRGRAAFAKMTNRLPDLVRLTVFRDEGLRDARDLFATLAARGTAVSLVLSGEPGALREVAHWGGTCATTCCVSLLPGDAQDPAAPEAASWLLDHFIEISRALAGARAAGGTKAAA